MTSHLRHLIDALPHAVLVHRNGRPLFANAKFSGLTGCPPDDLDAVKALVAGASWRRWLTHSGEQAAVTVEDRHGQPLSLRARRTEVPWKGGPAWLETFDVRDGGGEEENPSESFIEYRALADGAGHGMLVHRDGTVLYINPHLVRLLGFGSSRQAYRGNAALGRFAPADVERFLTQAQGVEEDPGTIEVPVNRPGAAPLWLETRSTSIDWQGTPATATVMVDVTARRLSAQALAAQARNHAHAEQVALIGHWEWHLSSQAITWSDGAYRIYGRRREEFQPTVKNALSAIHPDDREAVADALNVALREGRSFTHEFRAVSPDGTVRLCVEQVSVDLDSSGNPARLFGVLMDVTEARRVEQELKDSRRLLETVLESIPHSLFVKDAESRFLLVNSAEAAVFQLRPEQMAGMHTRDLPGVAPEAIERALQEDRSIVETGRPVVLERRRAVHRDDPTGWRRVIKVPLRNAQGRIVGVVGLSEDITQRVQAEERLKTQQQLLDTLIETIPHGIFVRDAGGRFLLANSAYARAFGLAREQVAGLTMDQLPGLSAEAVEAARAEDKAILASTRPIVDREFPSPAPNTPNEVYRMLKVPMRDEEGRVVAVVGVVEDITERRRAESRVQESEQLLKSMLESMPHAVFVKDLGGRYRLVNSQFAARFGMAPEQVIGLRPEDLPGVSGAFLQMMLDDDRRVLEGGETVVRDDVPAPSPLQQGQWRRLIKRRLLNRNGEVIGIIGTTEDITERKEAERRLQESEQLLQSVIECIPQGLFAKDLEGRYLLTNRLYAARGGGTPQQLLGRRFAELPAATPEFAALMAEDDRRVLETGEEVAREEWFNPPPPYGQPLWLRIIKRRLFDRQGRVVGIIGTTEDITARRRAEQQVRESQRLLQTIIDTLPQAVFLKDLEGRYVLVNETYSRIRGVAREDVLGHPTEEGSRGTPEQVRRWLAQDQEVIRTGRPVTDPEYLHTYPDGHTGIRSMIKLPFLDADGKLTGILGVSEDITERKQAQERIRSGERLLQAVFDTIPHSVFVKDRQGRYTAINRAMAELWGTRPEDVIGRRVIAGALRPEDESLMVDHVDRLVLEQGQSTENTPRQTLPDGRVLTMRVKKSPLRDESGQVIGLVGTAEDITERVEAERRLRDSERLLQTVIDTLPQAIFLKDLQGRYLVVNDAYARLHGLTKEEALHTPVEQQPGGLPEEKEIWLRLDRQVIETGMMAMEEPMPFTTPSGVRRLRSLVKLPVHDSSGRLAGILGVSEDITERIEAEQRLRQSQRLLQTLIDTLPQAVFLKDTSGRHIVVNDAFAAIRGKPKSELIGATTEELGHPVPKEAAQWVADDREVITQRRAIGPKEYAFTMPDGRATTRVLYKLPFFDDSGAVIGVLGVSEDVTERHAAEERLRASEQLLQTVFDTLPLDVWVKNRERRFLRVNTAMARRWHSTPEAMVGQMAPAMPEAPEGELGRIAATDLQVLNEGRVIDMHMTRTEPGGRRRIQHMIKAPLRDAKGAIIGLVGISEDVTELRQAEQELRASQRLLRTVFETIPHPVFVKDRDGRYIAVNRAMTDLWRTPAEEIIGQKVVCQALRPPEEVQSTQQSDQEVTSTGKPVAFIRSQTLLDSTVHRLSIKKTPLLDESGAVIGLVGMLEDITEQEQAQEALRTSQRLLNAIINALPLGLTARDRQGRIVLVNTALLSHYGRKAEELLGRTSLELPWLDPQDARRFHETDLRVLATGEPLFIPQDRQVMPDGRVLYRRVIKSPIVNDKGEVSGLVVVTEDITQQMRAEQELKESQRLLKTIFDHLPYGLTAKNREGRYILVNEALLKRYGAKLEDFLGRKSSEIPFFAPTEGQAFEREDEQVFATGEMLWMPKREIRYPDGTTRVRQFVKIPIKDEHGRVTGVITASDDITQQVAAEQEVLRSRALLQAIFDTIPMDIVVKDADSRIVAMNRRMIEAFGLSEGEMMGRQTPIPIEPGSMDRILAVDQEVMRTGRLREEVQQRAMPDGSIRHYRVLKSPLREASGQVTGVVGVAEDITERLAAEAELQRSKALLQAIFDTIPHDVWVKDREARYVSANRQLLLTFGRTMEEIAGRHTALPATPEEQEMILQSDYEVLREGKIVDRVQDRRFPDGTVRQFRIIKTPLRDETGAVTGLVGMAEDVTERMRAERELRENRQLLQTVFDALPVWVFVKDRERRLLMVNRQMAADYGMDPTGLLSGGEGDPADLETQATSRKLDLEVLQTGRRVETPEFPFSIRGQPTRILRSVRVPLTDAQGHITGIVGISEDITERKRAEQALLQTQKLESLGILAGGIAHDFNNLLTGILGNVELALLELEAGHHARGPLTNVKNASLMAAGLTRQMLAYSGGGRFELRPIELNALVEDMAQLLRVTVPRHVNVVYRFQPALPLVEADASQLQQVIMNLITNAAEAIGERPGDIVLTTGTTRATRAELESYHLAGEVGEGEYVFLQVADTGSGMPPATMQRIFDPFFTTKFTGRGLGLAAVLGIVRSHKGAIRVTSEVGQGTTFRILLPPAGAAAPRPAPAPAGAWSGGGTVLVVDDEAPVRQVAAAMLRELGMNVLEAAGGEEGLRALREHPGGIAWVLLDASMPGLSGPDTLRALREIAPDLTVVMMSGYGERELQDRFRGMNIRGFLQKPFTFEDLRAKLGAWLGQTSPAGPRAS